MSCENKVRRFESAKYGKGAFLSNDVFLNIIKHKTWQTSVLFKQLLILGICEPQHSLQHPIQTMVVNDAYSTVMDDIRT